MVTRKRRIETEQDRFGGYGNLENQSRADQTFVDKPHTIDVEDARLPPTSNTPFEYTTRRQDRNVYTAPQTDTLKRNKMEPEDVMPSIRTMSYLDKVEKSKASREKMEGKTKVMLAVYMVVVIMLAAIVIATGVAISNANSSSDKLSSMIAAQNAKILEQESALNLLNDEDAIRGKASQQNMVNRGEVIELELIPIKNPVVYKARTNWFDKFCDWLGSIIGG